MEEKSENNNLMWLHEEFDTIMVAYCKWHYKNLLKMSLFIVMYMVHPLYLAQHESKPYCFQGFFTYFSVPNRSPGPNKRTGGRISSN